MKAAFFIVLWGMISGVAASSSYDLVIANGRVMDPETGLDAVRYVGIEDGTIRAIAEAPLEGREVIDASDLVVAPGFIDVNTYEHGDSFYRLRAADGVTSVLHLEDGAVDVAAYYRAHEGRSLLHHGVAVGASSLRAFASDEPPTVTGDGFSEEIASELDGRALTAEEIDRLAELVDRGLREGAVAVGFGIEYTPGANHTEILRLFEVAEEHGASSHLHIRDFHETLEWSQLYEIFGGAIHTGGDFHVNHLQSVFGSYSGPALEFIDRARDRSLSITAECYPYTAGMTFIESALFDDWSERPDENFERLEWAVTGERLTRESFSRYREQGGVVTIHPRDPEKQEAAVRTCLAHPLTMVASDGAWDDGKTHPRSAGTNSRVLGRYVREESILPLMEALRKMSLAPAKHLERRVPAMRRKGRVQVGSDADLVLFDPHTVLDRATYAEPTLPPSGIEHVLVRGTPVVSAGEIVEHMFPGEPIRAPLAQPRDAPFEDVASSATEALSGDEAVITRVTWISVPPGARPEWERSAREIASASREADLSGIGEWLVYRIAVPKDGSAQYLVVSFSDGDEPTLTPDAVADAIVGTLREGDFERALDALKETGFEIDRDLTMRMRADWSTVAEIFVATHPRARLVEYLLAPDEIDTFDAAADAYIDLLVELGFPYPIEGHGGSIGAPNRAFLVYFLDEWAPFLEAYDLPAWVAETGRSDEVRRALERLTASASRVEPPLDLEFAAELSP